MENETDDFRGLLYNPTLENEVVMLFCIMIPDLEDRFAIEEGDRGSFPDCFALRNGKKVGIEFEFVASKFFNHENNDNLTKCSLLVCWKNDIRNVTKREGKEFFTVKGHEIEIIALDKEVAKLERDKGLKFIKDGDRPDIYRGFFEQLKDKRPKRYDWIKELYDQVKQSEDFEIKWGGGKRWLTMQFFVKKWGIHPINIEGNGNVWVTYRENPKMSPWELPQETKAELRQIFKKTKPWHIVPLDAPKDLENIREALKILAEHSKRFDIIWHTED